MLNDPIPRPRIVAARSLGRMEQRSLLPILKRTLRDTDDAVRITAAAGIVKTFGLLMTIAGGFLGGMLTVRYGVLKILFLGGVLAAASRGTGPRQPGTARRTGILWAG